jgi:hypothetical protein
MFGLLAGALGGIATGIGKAIANRRANKVNSAQWDKQNQYNAPSKQMERLKEAGLNPNLIYGSSPSNAAGNADSMTPRNPTDFDIKFDNRAQSQLAYADIQVKNATTDNLAEQNKVLIQDQALKAAQIAQIVAGTSKTKQETRHASQLFRTSLDAAKENLTGIRLNNVGKSIQNDINEIQRYVQDNTKAQQIAKALYEARMAKANLTGKQLENAISQIEYNLQRTTGLDKNTPWYVRLIGRHFSTYFK